MISLSLIPLSLSLVSLVSLGSLVMVLVPLLMLVGACRYRGGLGRRACCLLVASLLVTSCASICDVWPVVESTVVFSTIFSIPAQAMAVCYATASTAIPGVLVPNTVPTSVVVLAKDFGPHLVCSFLKCA